MEGRGAGKVGRAEGVESGGWVCLEEGGVRKRVVRDWRRVGCKEGMKAGRRVLA